MVGCHSIVAVITVCILGVLSETALAECRGICRGRRGPVIRERGPVIIDRGPVVGIDVRVGSGGVFDPSAGPTLSDIVGRRGPTTQNPPTTTTITPPATAVDRTPVHAGTTLSDLVRRASDPVRPGEDVKVPSRPPSPPTPPEDPLACRDPKRAICGDKSQDSKAEAYEKRNAGIVEEVFRETGLSEQALIGAGVVVESRYELYIRSLKEKIEKVSLRDMSAIATEVKNHLAKALSERVSPESSAQDMANTVRGVKIMKYSDLVLKRQSLMPGFILNCGGDGLSFNAVFFQNIPGEGPVQALCPSYFGADVAKERLMVLMGHELGHSIDHDQHPGLYRKLVNCIASDQPDFSQNLYSESTADFWAAKVAGQALRGKSPESALAFAQAAYEKYCYRYLYSQLKYPASLDEVRATRRKNPRHPERDFRLTTMFARDAEIYELLGCKRTKRSEGAPPLCALTGSANTGS